MTVLSIECLKKYLRYCPSTGIFYFTSHPDNGLQEGDPAGYLDDTGYIRVRIEGVSFSAHRLAFLFMTGREPGQAVDHINHDPTDNRWCNLRECTLAQNSGNAKLRKDNKTGFKGVRKSKSGKYVASMRYNGKSVHLGTFCTPEEAHQAYCKAAEDQYGEFSYPKPNKSL